MFLNYRVGTVIYLLHKFFEVVTSVFQQFYVFIVDFNTVLHILLHNCGVKKGLKSFVNSSLKLSKL